MCPQRLEGYDYICLNSSMFWVKTFFYASKGCQSCIWELGLQNKCMTQYGVEFYAEQYRSKCKYKHNGDFVVV